MMNVSQGPLEFSEAPEGECDGRGEGGSPGQGDGRHQQGQQDRGARQTRPVQPQGQLTGSHVSNVMSYARDKYFARKSNKDVLSRK